MILTDAIVLRVSDITEHGVRIETIEEPEWLINLPELSEGKEYKTLSKVRVALEVTRVLKEVTVTGNVSLSLQSPCSRCVEPVKVELDSPVSLVLSPLDKLQDEDDDLEDIL